MPGGTYSYGVGGEPYKNGENHLKAGSTPEHSLMP